jgi:hypothetical protein
LRTLVCCPLLGLALVSGARSWVGLAVWVPVLLGWSLVLWGPVQPVLEWAHCAVAVPPMPTLLVALPSHLCPPRLGWGCLCSCVGLHLGPISRWRRAPPRLGLRCCRGGTLPPSLLCWVPVWTVPIFVPALEPKPALCSLLLPPWGVLRSPSTRHRLVCHVYRLLFPTSVAVRIRPNTGAGGFGAGVTPLRGLPCGCLRDCPGVTPPGLPLYWFGALSWRVVPGWWLKGCLALALGSWVVGLTHPCSLFPVVALLFTCWVPFFLCSPRPGAFSSFLGVVAVSPFLFLLSGFLFLTLVPLRPCAGSGGVGATFGSPLFSLAPSCWLGGQPSACHSFPLFLL